MPGPTRTTVPKEVATKASQRDHGGVSLRPERVGVVERPVRQGAEQAQETLPGAAASASFRFADIAVAPPSSTGWMPPVGRGRPVASPDVAGEPARNPEEGEEAVEKQAPARRQAGAAAGEGPPGPPTSGPPTSGPLDPPLSGVFPLRFKRHRDLVEDPRQAHRTAAWGFTGSAVALPHFERIQRSFGHHALDSVRAYLGPPARRAAAALEAEAFTRGENIAFRRFPDLDTAAHEAAHVVQQRAGVLPGGLGQLGDPFERAADAVAARVTSGLPATDLLPPVSAGEGSPPGVQRRRVLGVLPEGADPDTDDEIFLVPGSNTTSGIVEEVRDWVTERHQNLVTAGKITEAQAGEMEKAYGVAIVGGSLNLYTLSGRRVGSYSYEKQAPDWPVGYYVETTDSQHILAPVLRGTTFDFSTVTLTDLETGEPIKPSNAGDWLGDRELERCVKDLGSNGLTEIVIAVPAGGSTGPGNLEAELAWSKGPVDELKKKLKELAPPDAETGPTGAKPPGKAGQERPPGEADTTGEGEAKAEGERDKDKDGPPPQKPSAEAQEPLPDKVVRWLDANGAHLNVWVDGAAQSLKLMEGETVDELLERVKRVAKALKEGRDPEKSLKVADGVEQTSVVNEKGEPVGSATALPPEQAIPGGDRRANTPAYPARVINFGPDITVSGASNRFQMKIDYRPAGYTTLDQVAARLQHISYYWEIFNVTGLTPEAVAAAQNAEVGSGEQKTVLGGMGDQIERDHRGIAEDAAADIDDLFLEADPVSVALTWQARAAWLGVVGLSSGIRSLGSLISSFIDVVTTPANEQSVGFSEPGDYIVRCVATPKAADDATLVRASSVAVAAVRVQNLNQRAQEANDEPLRQLEELRKELEGLPDGDEKDALAKRIAALEGAEEQSALDSAKITEGVLEQKLAVLTQLDQDIAGHVPRIQRSAEVRLLDAQLQLLEVRREAYREQLERQLAEVRAIKTRAVSFGAQFKAANFRPQVTLASEENGMVTQMLMLLGEASGSKEGKVRWVLADITSRKTQQVYEGSSSKSGVAGHQEAIRKAFVDFRENAEYGRGTIAIRLPQGVSTYAGGPVVIEPRMRAAPGSHARAMGRLRDLATAAELAGLVISGPVGLAIGAAGAAAGAIVAIDSLSKRASGDRLQWDFETIMDVSSVVGGVVGLGGATAGALRNLPRWVNRVERVEGALRIYGVTELGAQIIIIPVQLELQLQEIDQNTGLSPGEKAARRAEAILQAVRSGAMGVVSAAQMLQVDPGTHQPQVGEGPVVEAGSGGAAGKPAAAESGAPRPAPEAAEAPQSSRPTKPAVEESPGPAKGEGRKADGDDPSGGVAAEGVQKPPEAEPVSTGAGGLPRRPELEDALGDLKGKVQVVEHPTLEGTQVRYLGGEVVVEIGAKTAAKKGRMAVAQHAATARELLRYNGPFGAIRKLASKILGLLKITPGYGSQGFESRLEVRKLRAIIGELEGLMARIDAHAADLGKRNVDVETTRKEISEEIAHLEQQLAEHQALVDSYDPGRGFVAALSGSPQALMNATLLELGQQFPQNNAVEKGPLIRIDDLLELHPSFIQDLKGRKTLGGANQSVSDLDLVLDATRALREKGGDRSLLTPEQQKILSKASSSGTYRLDFEDSLGTTVDKAITDFGLDRLQVFKDLLAKPVEDAHGDRSRLLREFVSPSIKIGSKADGVWTNKVAGPQRLGGADLQAMLYRYAADYAASKNPQSISDFVNHFQFYLSEKDALRGRMQKQVTDLKDQALDQTPRPSPNAALDGALEQVVGIPNYSGSFPQGQTLGGNQITGAVWAKVLSDASDARMKLKKQTLGDQQEVGRRFELIGRETAGHVGVAQVATGLDPTATVAAVQGLPEVPMASVSGAAYHAAKHHKEVFEHGFPGTTDPAKGPVEPAKLFAEYWAAAQSAIKSPDVAPLVPPAVSPDPATGGLKLQFKKNGMTALVLVKPDGTVRMLTFFAL